MKSKLFLIIFLGLSLVGFAQEDEVLLTINKEPVYASEFKRVYEKNLDQIKDEEKEIDKNLELFINYKLKLIEAYQLKLDTNKTYLTELNSYKNQLMAPYLYDKDFKAQLLKQAYERTNEEVRAGHILIAFNKKESDTVAMKQKLNDIKKRIEAGEAFDKLAKEFSDDPSAKVNGGDLGYFSAFRMVYQFEEAAYTTEIGKVSAPFKTRFGYHILKVTDKRKSRGEVEASHVLIRGDETKAKQKIDSLYAQLKAGKISFEDVAKEYSEDRASGANGGRLPKFGSGRMVLPFENAVFSLNKEGEYSEPFKTRFGWHIVKLIKKHPVKPFEEMKEELQRRIRTTNRENLSTQKLIDDLKKKYNVTENQKNRSIAKQTKQGGYTKEQNELEVLSIDGTSVKLASFVKFIENKNYLGIDALWEKFKNEKVLNYYKDHLPELYPDYKNTLQEYKDGLLLFDLMKMKVWDKSQNDKEALESYFNNNKAKYNGALLADIKGKVVSDYQNHIENKWIEDLRAANKIKVRKKVLKKLKKDYAN